MVIDFMAKFEGGVKAAAKMLAGLTKNIREKILRDMRARDPKMAELINEQIFSFEDLIHLTPTMVIDLLRSVKIKDLALALKTADFNLKEHILTNSPRLIRQEIEDVLNGPLVLVSAVEEAKKRVMEVVILKIEKGEIVLHS